MFGVALLARPRLEGAKSFMCEDFFIFEFFLIANLLLLRFEVMTDHLKVIRLIASLIPVMPRMPGNPAASLLFQLRALSSC